MMPGELIVALNGHTRLRGALSAQATQNVP